MRIERGLSSDEVHDHFMRKLCDERRTFDDQLAAMPRD